MCNIELTWAVSKNGFAAGEDGKLGSIVVFKIFWDAFSSREEKLKWKLSCYLPGIKDTFGPFETTDEAKQKAASVLGYWLEMAEIKISP